MISNGIHDALHFNTTHSPLSLKEMEDSFQNSSFKSVINHYHTTNTDQILKILSCNLSNFWGYEVKLGSENASDLLICISEAQKAKLLQDLQNPLLKSPEWEMVKKIITLWNNPQSRYSQEIVNVWLEFDQKGNEIPNPNFFIAPNPILSTPALRELFQRTFNETLNSPLEKPTLDNLTTISKSLPYEAWIPQIGMMLARNQTNIRAYLHKIPKNRMISYLEKIGWKNTKGEFKRLFERLYKFSDFIDLDLDISNDIGDTIGLECYFSKADPKSLKKMFDYLESIGYACDTMLQKIQEYVHNTCLTKQNYCKEFLHHIKIIYTPSGNCEAKAYLAIRKNNY